MKTEKEIKAQIAALQQQRDIATAAYDGAIKMLEWALTTTTVPAPVTQEATDGAEKA